MFLIQPTVVTLFRPWIRRTYYDDRLDPFCGFRTSSKSNGQEFEETYWNIRSLETPKQLQISFNTKCLRQQRVRIDQLFASDAVR